MKRLLMTCIAGILLCINLLPGQSFATPLSGSSHYKTTLGNGVSVDIVPFYAWIPGMTGKTTVLGVTANLDFTPLDVIENLGDLLEVLDSIYMGAGEVRYGKLGFMYDVFHMGVSSSGSIDGRFIRGNIDVGFTHTFATLAGAYRLVETPRGYFDLLAGVRIWDVTADVGVNLNIFGLHAKDGDTWIDPLVGAKGRIDLTESVFFTGWGLVGGVVTGSDFMWDVWGNFGYRINDTIDVFAGLRATGTDYRSGGFVWDMTQWGPVIGGTIKLN